MSSITSSNAILMIAIPDLYPVPQQIQGFAMDDMFDTADIAPIETSMGVDGRMSGGFVHVSVPLSITLQADSDSNMLFDAWYAAMVAANEVYWADAIVRIPGLSRSFVLTHGGLKGYKPIADAKRTMQPRKYSIEWQSIVGAPI